MRRRAKAGRERGASLAAFDRETGAMTDAEFVAFLDRLAKPDYVGYLEEPYRRGSAIGSTLTDAEVKGIVDSAGRQMREKDLASDKDAARKAGDRPKKRGAFAATALFCVALCILAWVVAGCFVSGINLRRAFSLYDGKNLFELAETLSRGGYSTGNAIAACAMIAGTFCVALFAEAWALTGLRSRTARAVCAAGIAIGAAACVASALYGILSISLSPASMTAVFAVFAFFVAVASSASRAKEGEAE